MYSSRKAFIIRTDLCSHMLDDRRVDPEQLDGDTI